MERLAYFKNFVYIPIIKKLLFILFNYRIFSPFLIFFCAQIKLKIKTTF